jgi:hypothetical protein
VSDVWYYAKDQEAVGPLSLTEIGAILSRVPIANRPLVWRNGLPGWVRAEDVKELAPYLVSPPPLTSAAIESSPIIAHSSRLDSWLLGAVCACTSWIFVSYAFYKNTSIVIALLVVVSVGAVGAALWTRRYKLLFGLVVGTPVGALIGMAVIDSQLDTDKAVALGFLSGSDMHEAQRLNLTPQQLADRRAQEAARAAAAEKQRREQEAAENACRNDWSKCADNGEVVNKYSDWTMVRVRCQREANEQARYGDPEWPWLSFGTYLKGTDYVKTGLAVAIEKDAKFQNGFGAKVHSEVICRYDLRSQKVISVSIAPR